MSLSSPPSSRTEREEAIVAEARRWIGTPWHHRARLHGVGVDCAQLLIAVYSSVGLIDEVETEHYPMDWHLHRDETRFLGWLEQFADPVPSDDPRPGDVAMFTFGRHPAHGAIVVEWPLVIHAWREEGKVALTDIKRSHIAERLAGFWRLRGVA
jgi:cell wall-associated NlpC family hydrolase